MSRERLKAARGEAKAFLSAAMASETDDCILWPFSLKPNGYAEVKIDGRMRYAHRIVCETSHGTPANPELEAAHQCGRRNCINKRHLRWATHKENHQDRITHGTSNRGIANGNAKLDERSVRIIRKAAGLGFCHQHLAESFGVSRRAVSSVVAGKTWGWV